MYFRRSFRLVLRLHRRHRRGSVLPSEFFSLLRFADKRPPESHFLFPCPGTFAGIIDIGTTWLSDLKLGVCLPAFWLARAGCCWSMSVNATSGQVSPENFDDGLCEEWKPWPVLFGLETR